VNSLVVEVDGKQHVNSTTDYIHHEHAYGRDDLLRIWGELRHTLYPPCIFLTLLCALCDYDWWERIGVGVSGGLRNCTYLRNK
jgi:hypothetical protein